MADDLMDPRATPTLIRDKHLLTALQHIIQERAIYRFGVGLPRNMTGEDTWQTTAVRDFANKVTAMNRQIDCKDEELTSVHAESGLRQRGQPVDKGGIDSQEERAISADYLTEAGVQMCRGG